MKYPIALTTILSVTSAIAIGCSTPVSQTVSQTGTQTGTQTGAEHHHGASASPSAASPASMNHGSMDHGSHLEMMEIPAGRPIPTVKLIVHPDARKGWNLEAQVTNFRFAPEHVNQTSVTTEGHAHIAINDQKLTRLYGNWYYLDKLPAGEQKVTVSLNANGHETLTYNNQPIQSSVMITVPN